MAKDIRPKQTEVELIYGMHPVFEVLQQKKRKIFEIFAALEGAC